MAASKKLDVEPVAPDIAILGNAVTIHPSGVTESSAARKRENRDHSRELVSTMARFRQSPIEWVREVSLHVNGTGWRAFDNTVGQPMFFPGFSEQMTRRVLNSPMLRTKMAELANKRAKLEATEGTLPIRGGNMMSQEDRRLELTASIKEVAEKMVDNMICKMESNTFIRGAYYIATQLLTRAYHQGIHVSSEEIIRLRAVAETAAKKKQSIIFLPSHRSHVDYVSLQLICFRLNLALPTVVAGDNLNFPLVGPFLQSAGAMWIRRSFGNDQLYSTVVQAYVDTLLQNGYNFECFIEGGRSRTGKLLTPKFGILRYLLDSLLSGRVDDAIVCPVSTQYDKVIEVDSYITELLGTPKQKESLAGFMSASSILNLKLGRIDVRFHEPWSLREFVDDQFRRYTKLPASMSNNENWTEERKVRLLRTLGYKVLSDINDVSVIMPTALIGTVLLTLRGRGVGKTELIRRVDWLCERVHIKGGRVAHFGNLPTETVIERGLEVLGPALVGRITNLPEETFYAVDRFQLSFYRNMTIHLFILEALICAGLYTIIKSGGDPSHQSMTYTELRSEVSFLSQLFSGEFIFPTDGLDANMRVALRRLEEDNVLAITRRSGVEDVDSPEAIELIELSEIERRRGRENFDFYCFLIWPFIEASWLGAVSLMMLCPTIEYISGLVQSSPASPNTTPMDDLWLDAKETHNLAQLLGKTLYYQGDLSYFEAVNKETLQNCYRRFEEDGMVVGRRPKDKDNKAAGGIMLRLADEWMPKRDSVTGQLIPEGRLWDFCVSISHSRLEGKNRRDSQTVQMRVMSLIEKISTQLWAEKAKKAQLVASGALDEDDTNGKKKKRRRRSEIGESKL